MKETFKQKLKRIKTLAKIHNIKVYTILLTIWNDNDSRVELIFKNDDYSIKIILY